MNPVTRWFGAYYHRIPLVAGGTIFLIRAQALINTSDVVIPLSIPEFWPILYAGLGLVWLIAGVDGSRRWRFMAAFATVFLHMGRSIAVANQLGWEGLNVIANFVLIAFLSVWLLAMDPPGWNEPGKR